jgi:hypothetical protein
MTRSRARVRLRRRQRLNPLQTPCSNRPHGPLLKQPGSNAGALQSGTRPPRPVRICRAVHCYRLSPMYALNRHFALRKLSMGTRLPRRLLLTLSVLLATSSAKAQLCDQSLLVPLKSTPGSTFFEIVSNGSSVPSLSPITGVRGPRRLEQLYGLCCPHSSFQ